MFSACSSGDSVIPTIIDPVMIRPRVELFYYSREVKQRRLICLKTSRFLVKLVSFTQTIKKDNFFVFRIHQNEHFHRELKINF